jgi:hypothetical protein
MKERLEALLTALRAACPRAGGEAAGAATPPPEALLEALEDMRRASYHGSKRYHPRSYPAPPWRGPENVQSLGACAMRERSHGISGIVLTRASRRVRRRRVAVRRAGRKQHPQQHLHQPLRQRYRAGAVHGARRARRARACHRAGPLAAGAG